MLRSAAFTPGEIPRYSFYRRLSGPQGQSGHEGVKKNLHPSETRDRTRAVQPAAKRLAAWATWPTISSVLLQILLSNICDLWILWKNVQMDRGNINPTQHFPWWLQETTKRTPISMVSTGIWTPSSSNTSPVWWISIGAMLCAFKNIITVLSSPSSRWEPE